MAKSAVPHLTSIVPLPAVPGRLRAAVEKTLGDWSYGWSDLTLAGTAELGAGREIWVFAVTAGPVSIGDELESAGGRGAGVGVSGYSGGVIPVTPYQAWVYEYLGRRGGGSEPELPSPPELPTIPDMEPASPDRQR